MLGGRYPLVVLRLLWVGYLRPLRLLVVLMFLLYDLPRQQVVAERVKPSRSVQPVLHTKL